MIGRLPALVATTAAALVTVGGCGIDASGVTAAGDAPTGIASGVTLYFLDADGALRPQVRKTGHLGSVPEAVSLLLAGPAGSDLATGIDDVDTTLVHVATASGVIELRVPLSVDEVTPAGVDQIVCTALAAHIQAGGDAATTVRIAFTIPAPDSARDRTCPLSPRS